MILVNQMHLFFALNDKEYYCNSCFKKAHDKNKKSNHKMEKIDIYVTIEIYCQSNLDININIFCADEKGK